MALQRKYWETACVIAMWYVSNAAIAVTNKALLSTFAFQKPLLLTLLHMATCSALGHACMRLESDHKPLATCANLGPTTVLALIFCASVSFGNAALEFIPVSFAQAIAAITPFFTAVLSAAAGKRERVAVYACLVPIVGGIIATVHYEPSFNKIGLNAALMATLLRAGKSVLQEVILGNPTARPSSMCLLRRMATISCLLLVVPVFVWEGDGVDDLLRLCWNPMSRTLLCANLLLSYAVNLTQFMVTQRTSAVSLQVLGNVKGVFTVFVSVAIFHNSITPQGVLGYTCAVMGAYFYGHFKRADETMIVDVKKRIGTGIQQHV
jgi:drug/metabolite transporter (DMT)-like permease